jgi:hypothetical protein
VEPRPLRVPLYYWLHSGQRPTLASAISSDSDAPVAAWGFLDPEGYGGTAHLVAGLWEGHGCGVLADGSGEAA